MHECLTGKAQLALTSRTTLLGLTSEEDSQHRQLVMFTAALSLPIKQPKTSIAQQEQQNGRAIDLNCCSNISNAGVDIQTLQQGVVRLFE